MESSTYLLLFESACLGGLMAWLGRVSMDPDDVDTSGLDPVARVRRDERRKESWYRLFETLIDRLAAWNRTLLPWAVEWLEERLKTGGRGSFDAAQVLALREVQSFPWALVCVLAGILLAGFSLILTTIMFGFGFLLVTAIGVWRELKRAKTFRRRLRARLPFALEMMAVLSESGGVGLERAIEITAQENKGHPLGDVLSTLSRLSGANLSLTDALTEWKTRHPDEDLAEIAFVLTMTRQRGSTIKESLRALAEQFRLRRLQRLESAAEEAKVHMTWPGMLVMLACLLIVSAPFILTARDVLNF